MSLSCPSQVYVTLACLFAFFFPIYWSASKSQDQGDSRKHQTTQNHYNLPILILLPYFCPHQLPLILTYTLGTSLEVPLLLEIRGRTWVNGYLPHETVYRLSLVLQRSEQYHIHDYVLFDKEDHKC